MLSVFCAECGPCLFRGHYGDVDPDKRNIKPEEDRAQGGQNTDVVVFLF